MTGLLRCTGVRGDVAIAVGEKAEYAGVDQLVFVKTNLSVTYNPFDVTMLITIVVQ